MSEIARYVIEESAVEIRKRTGHHNLSVSENDQVTVLEEPLPLMYEMSEQDQLEFARHTFTTDRHDLPYVTFEMVESPENKLELAVVIINTVHLLVQGKGVLTPQTYRTRRGIRSSWGTETRLEKLFSLQRFYAAPGYSLSLNAIGRNTHLHFNLQWIMPRK